METTEKRITVSEAEQVLKSISKQVLVEWLARYSSLPGGDRLIDALKRNNEIYEYNSLVRKHNQLANEIKVHGSKYGPQSLKSKAWRRQIDTAHKLHRRILAHPVHPQSKPEPKI